MLKEFSGKDLFCDLSYYKTLEDGPPKKIKLKKINLKLLLLMQIQEKKTQLNLILLYALLDIALKI